MEINVQIRSMLRFDLLFLVFEIALNCSDGEDFKVINWLIRKKPSNFSLTSMNGRVLDMPVLSPLILLSDISVSSLLFFFFFAVPVTKM